MLKKILVKIRLTDKYTRRQLADFTAKHGTSTQTLDIGSSGPAKFLGDFPNCTTLDFIAKEGVDIVADVHDLNNFDDDSYESIILFEVLEHLHSPHVALDELFRVLAPGGTLLLSTRFIYPFHGEPNDYYRFTEQGLRFLLSKFEIEEIVPESTTAGAVGVVLERIGRQTETLGIRQLAVLWFIASRIMIALSFVLTSQYTTIHKSERISQIASSGYYVACRKPLLISEA
jgi:SAM-dependent methyltransferase